MNVSMYTSWDTTCGIADYSCQFKAALEKTGVAVRIVPVGKKKGLFDLIRNGKMMNNADVALIQHQFPFFAHSFLIRSFVHCVFFLRQIKIPKVLTMHEVVPLGDQLGRFSFLRLYQTIFASVDLITVHTEKHREIVLEMGIQADKVMLMPHPIPEVTPPLDAKQHYKTLLGLEGKQVLTVFGFFNSRKGYELVLDAIQDLDDCVFLIAGGPFPGDKSGYAERLINTIKEMNLEQRVKILGYLPESQIPAVMGATDIVLAPFRDMPGSGSLSLGVAYGKAIIGSDIEQMKELQTRGIGAELFQIDKRGDLREKIVALTGDARRQAELEQLSKSYADTYSYSNTAVRLEKRCAALILKS